MLIVLSGGYSTVIAVNDDAVVMSYNIYDVNDDAMISMISMMSIIC